MNSFNHYAYGSAGQWMFSALAGIETAEPGFQRIQIRPRIGGGLAFVRAHYDSIHGRIGTHWQRSDAGILLEVTVPPNTTAVVYVPAKKVAAVREGDGPAGEAPGVKFLRRDEGSAVYAVGSGTYRFSVPHDS
jgi:alpha-L-rhamnosidase